MPLRNNTIRCLIPAIGVGIFDPWFMQSMMRRRLLGVIIFDLRYKQAETRNRPLYARKFELRHTRYTKRNRALGREYSAYNRREL